MSLAEPVTALPGSASATFTVVGIPSINVPLDADHDLASSEARWIYLAFALLRRPGLQVVVVTSEAFPAAHVDHHLSLIGDAPNARERLHLVSVDDSSRRPLAQKLLDRPRALARIRELAGACPGCIVPFDVRAAELEVAQAIGLPIDGVSPSHWRLGTKSGARRVLAEAGVPVPAGAQDVRDANGVATAIAALRRERPGLDAVVVKHDEGTLGEGNAIVALDELPNPGARGEHAALLERVARLDPGYVRGLAAGGVVEELVTGIEVRSPSAQLRIAADGEVAIVGTHDQRLGGELGQSFVGSTFPADRAYGHLIADAATRVGRRLAQDGVSGRVAVDFVVTREHTGDWRPYAVEINLREGGTTHTLGTLEALVGGGYDPATTTYRAANGAAKHYTATDRLQRDAYRSIPVDVLLAAATSEGLIYDPASQTGVVPLMLRALEREGRIAIVAIEDSAVLAEELRERFVALLDRLAGD